MYTLARFAASTSLGLSCGVCVEEKRGRLLMGVVMVALGGICAVKSLRERRVRDILRASVLKHVHGASYGISKVHRIASK